MSSIYKQPGNVLPLTAPTGGVVVGTFYKIGQLLVRAMTTAAAGASFEGQTEGVWSNAPKTTGVAWVEGTLLYWDDTGKKFSTVATANLLAGVAVVAAASGDAVGTIRLNGAAKADGA